MRGSNSDNKVSISPSKILNPTYRLAKEGRKRGLIVRIGNRVRMTDRVRMDQ